MKKIKWGIIGCGDVAEVKSGPAFQETCNSELVAVMRRNGEKAKEFATRHKVPVWYDSAESLLKDPEVNAVYIATPPSTHLELALKALETGKDIYLEKPMALNYAEAEEIVKALKSSSSKLTIAHYRRQLPVFQKIKNLLDSNIIGDVHFADVKILQSAKPSVVAETEENWRVEPSISGGGYFHDLAPHHLDLMYWYFGEVEEVKGLSANQAKRYAAADFVIAMISFKNDIHFNGVWSFNVSEKESMDSCKIYGSKGSLEFSFFGDQILLTNQDGENKFYFEIIPHVQQPMIEASVNYFMDKGPNPCTAEEGLSIMKIMDQIVGK